MSSRKFEIISYLQCSYFLVFTILCLSSSVSTERNITAVQAPGCKNYSKTCNISFYHISALGPNDALHYIWDLVNKPSCLFALTPKESSLQIDWYSFWKSERSISFTPNASYLLVLILDSLIEYNDVNDTGLYTNSSKKYDYDTSLFTWEPIEPPVSSGQYFSFAVKSKGFIGENNQLLNGSITLELTAFGNSNHDMALPRLLHSANSSQVKIILEGLSSSSGFSSSRWAVSLILVTSDLVNQSLTVDTRKNLDDENSPGIFSMVNILTPDDDLNFKTGGFLQWRPLIYTSVEPSISNSSEVNVMNPVNFEHPDLMLMDTLAYKYFGKTILQNLVQSVFVSFGASQDGFYKKTNYTSWTFILGHGRPEDEHFSMLVILVMAIGLGLPAIISLSGGIFLCVRRFSKRKDELSLGR